MTISCPEVEYFYPIVHEYTNASVFKEHTMEHTTPIEEYQCPTVPSTDVACHSALTLASSLVARL